MRDILAISLIFISALINAQNIGGFSPKLDWLFIDQKNYKIIFNPINESSANEFDYYLNSLSEKNFSIGHKRKKISIILRHQNTTPNGFVAFTPFRSEIYMTPHPSNFALGSLNWNYLLALHEYQHVLQMSNSLNGISKWAYFLGGEIFWSTTLGFSVPNWFFEGEAVRAESEMSKQGRWRIPHFFNGFREMAYNNKFYNYSVARNGSLRKYVPDHYKLGSILIGYGNTLNHNGFWKNVFHEATAYKSPFYSFGRAVKRNSGYKMSEFYKNACENYKNKLDNIEQFHYKMAWPSYQKDDLVRESILVEDKKHGLFYYRYHSNDAIPQLMQLNEKQSNKTIDLPFQIDEVFDIYDHQLITAASYVHPRWNQESYQDLVKYDLESKKKHRITRGGRYFSPIWVDEGTAIICIHINSNGDSHLVKLDQKGNELKSYNNRDNYYISYPKVFAKNKLVVNLRSFEGQNCLALFDLEKEEYKPITDWNYHQTGIPYVKGDSILFSASYEGIDHIYLYHQQKFQQLTFGQEPQYMPTIKANQLYFQSFKLMNSKFESIPLNKIQAKTINKVSNSAISPYELNDSLVIKPFSSPNQLKSIQDYKKAKHLLNVHSWTPILEDPLYKLELIAEDVLGTFRGELAATYNHNEKGFGQEVRLVYGQYFTVFSLALENRARSIKRLNLPDFKFNETEVHIKSNWPLNYSSGTFSRRLNFSSNISYKTFYNQSEHHNFGKLWSSTLSQSVKIAKRRAVKNISSPLGISANWSQSLSLNSNQSQYKFFNSFSSKGLAKNHNIILDFDAQFQNNPSTSAFENSFFVNRGYNSYQHDFQARIGINYHFPIVYPDFGMLGIVYLYRIRGNVFTDLGQIEIGSISEELLNAGSELIFDMNLFNQFPFSMGVRYSRILRNSYLATNRNQNQFEVFIPISRF